MNLGEDGCGMSGKLRACFPFYFSGIFIEGEKGLFGTTPINNYQIIHDQWRTSVFPAWLIPACSLSTLTFQINFPSLADGNRGTYRIISPYFSSSSTEGVDGPSFLLYCQMLRNFLRPLCSP